MKFSLTLSGVTYISNSKLSCFVTFFGLISISDSKLHTFLTFVGVILRVDSKLNFFNTLPKLIYIIYSKLNNFVTLIISYSILLYFLTLSRVIISTLDSKLNDFFTFYRLLDSKFYYFIIVFGGNFCFRLKIKLLLNNLRSNFLKLSATPA
jgi:hypothetical protein